MRVPIAPADVGLRDCTCLEENAVLASITQVMGIVPEFQSRSDRCAVVSAGEGRQFGTSCTMLRVSFRLIVPLRPISQGFKRQ